MIKIKRSGVFETNSSSSHSICISTEIDYVVPNYQETITISGGEYHSGTTCTSFQEKLNYIGQKFYGNPNFNKDILKEVVTEMTNCKQLIWDINNLSEGSTYADSFYITKGETVNDSDDLWDMEEAGKITDLGSPDALNEKEILKDLLFNVNSKIFCTYN